MPHRLWNSRVGARNGEGPVGWTPPGLTGQLTARAVTPPEQAPRLHPEEPATAAEPATGQLAFTS